MNSRLVNSTFLHSKEGCPLDVTGTGEGAYMVYFVSFLGTLAVLPGNIVSALLMDKIGRLRMLGKGTRAGCCGCGAAAAGSGQAVNRPLTTSCGGHGPEGFSLSCFVWGCCKMGAELAEKLL